MFCGTSKGVINWGKIWKAFRAGHMWAGSWGPSGKEGFNANDVSQSLVIMNHS